MGVACASAIPAPPKVPAASTALTAVEQFPSGVHHAVVPVSSLSACLDCGPHRAHRTLCIR